MKKTHLVILTGFVIAAMLTVTNCKKDESAQAPSLPDVSSLKMDTAFASNLKAGLTYDYTNFTTAYVTVGFWTAAAYVYTAIPVIAFEKATSAKPVYDATQKVWVWTYNFTYLLTNYTAELTASTGETKVNWTMYISKTSTPAEKFKWFEGESNFDNKSGSWQLYDPSKGASINVTWTRENSKTGTLRYTNVVEGDANKGGYIEFGKIDQSIDKYFQIKVINDAGTPANNGKTFKIEWSSTGKNGSISDVTSTPQKLGCWGSDYKDTACN